MRVSEGRSEWVCLLRLSMERVQSDVADGQKKVSELKRDLKSCQHQLNKCLTEVESYKNEREREIEQLHGQVSQS